MCDVRENPREGIGIGIREMGNEARNRQGKWRKRESEGTPNGRVASGTLGKARSRADEVRTHVVESGVLAHEVAHEKVTEPVELLAGECLREEISNVEVRADVENTKHL